MSATTKKSFTWIWIAALLTATVGISVRKIYCYCIGEARVTLFSTPDADCAAKSVAPAADCCKKAAESCCATGEKAAGDHSCTKKSTKVFQLKTEFLVDKPLQKSLDCPLWLHDLPFFARKIRPALCEASTLFNKAQPPPLPSGRDICLRHETFLC